MSKILVSACFLGEKVRYDGKDNLQTHAHLWEWVRAKNVISVCPEVIGGLPIPRSSAEIQRGKSAQEVLQGKAKVLTVDGHDVTTEYIEGAKKTLKLMKKNNITIAILKSRSPSCGSKQIYDGTYSRTLIDGMGITAALLRQHGIKVFDETQIDLALDMAEKE